MKLRAQLYQGVARKKKYQRIPRAKLYSEGLFIGETEEKGLCKKYQRGRKSLTNKKSVKITVVSGVVKIGNTERKPHFLFTITFFFFKFTFFFSIFK